MTGRGRVWETVLRALDGPGTKGEIRRKLRRYIFHEADGHATQRVAVAVLELREKGYVEAES